MLESVDDIYLRHDLLVLLCGLTESCSTRLQKILLSSDAPPNAIPLLVGILIACKNEILQTDSLLLLTRLAEGSSEVAKAIAFQSAMDSVLSLLSGLEGILAESALSLLLVLLKGNPSNQTLFFESGLLTRLSSLVNDEGSPNCLVLALQCLSSLLDQWVSRIVPSVQDSILANTVLLGSILKFSFDGSCGSEAFQLLALLLYRNSRGQDQIISMSYQGVPVVTLITRSALDHTPNAAWAFHELVTSQSDDRLKVQVCATFVAPPIDDEEDDGGTSATAGSLIIDALTGMVEDRKIAAMGLLSSLLLESQSAKRMALEHGTFDSTSESENEPSIGLLHSLLFDMVGTPKDNLSMLASHLMLLAVWFHEFPPASHTLLGEGPIFSFLLELLEQSYAHPEDQIVCQGLSAFLFAVCIGTTDGSALSDLKAIIRTKIGHEVFRGKWVGFTRHLLSCSHEHSAFVALFEGLHTNLLETALLPPGASLNPAMDQLKAEYQQSVNAYHSRNLELEQALANQQYIVDEWHQLRTRVAHLDSTLQSTQAELEMARLSLTASGGDAATALLAENDRLKGLADAYVSQMMAVEAENEELLRTLSEYEAREATTAGSSPKDRPSSTAAKLVGLFQQPAVIVAKLAPNEPPAHHPSATFDV